MLNYVGGAIIFIKAHFADRLECLLTSWKLCNAGDPKNAEAQASGEDPAEQDILKQQAAEAEKKKTHSKWRFRRRNDNSENDDGGTKIELGADAESGGKATDTKMSAQNVPTNYSDMFRFNAAVMGFGTTGSTIWMEEVLACFDNIVTNVANSARLQQECDILALRISQKATSQVNLAEYKSCMLASLRSLLPKTWDSVHEAAWAWLWENVERLIMHIHGKPPVWEKALGLFLDNLDEDQKYEARKEIYATFFGSCPSGQDYFKQSNTYLHFIADRIIQMTMAGQK
jgi:hypothetical protein